MPALAGPDVQATFCSTLVDQWVLDGVQHAVVAPGSRSTPMALALAARPEIALHVFHDERSAAFAALGIGLASGLPAVLLCTSGTAATHFHAAVVEADLSGVAMLVVTADRPPELRDVGAAQTIDQVKLYGASVRWYHDPGVPAIEAAPSWRSLARRSLAATLGADRGPVHLNLPFREPLVGQTGDLPAARLGAMQVAPIAFDLQSAVEPIAAALDHPRGLIVAGAGISAPDAVVELAEAFGWPLLADPRSGCRGSTVSVGAFDAILRHRSFADRHLPDVVVHIGDAPASKVLAEWLASAPVVQVRCSERPKVIDPTHTITHHVVGPTGEWCKHLLGALRSPADSSWLDGWIDAERRAQSAIESSLGGALSEPAVGREMSRFDGDVVVASSMPIRDVEWYGHPQQPARVLANRGANGIDGTIATAIGVALATHRPTAVVLGDIALLHDSSSLAALAARPADVRIVVVDNDGGGIFSFLPQATLLAGERFERLFGTPHGTDLVALAAAHGLPSATVTTIDELRSALARPGPHLARVVSRRAGNVEVHRALHDAVAVALGG